MFLLPVCTWCCSPKSDDVNTGGSGWGMPENCVVAAYITFISLLFSSRHHFRFVSAILNLQVHEVYDVADVGTTGKMRTKIAGISSLAGTKPEILLGVIYPPPTCNIRYKKHTCNRRVKTADSRPARLSIGLYRPKTAKHSFLCHALSLTLTWVIGATTGLTRRCLRHFLRLFGPSS